LHITHVEVLFLFSLLQCLVFANSTTQLLNFAAVFAAIFAGQLDEDCGDGQHRR
jgi:hypothetical protein